MQVHARTDFGSNENGRTRKLLVHRSEIENLLLSMKSRKLTLVPLGVYNKGRLVKIELALVRDKLKHEKRESLRRRDIERETQKELKGMNGSR